MPRELKNAIAIDYLYYALLPGKLFPQQRPRDPSENSRSFSELYRPADVSVFSAMDRALYIKFGKAFWTDNTWIIRSGNPRQTVAWLNCIPPDVRQLIRKVEITFTIVDLLGDLEQYSNALAKVLGHFPPPSWSNDLLAMNMIWHYNQSLNYVWEVKFNAITHLGLDELTLDFIDAVSIDGHFHGVNFALLADWALVFRRQSPRKLNVWAPETDLAWQINTIITDLNMHLLDVPDDIGWQEVVWMEL